MSSKVTGWIINIGTELTIGRIVNTNGAWLARELTLRGIEVRRIIVIPDIEEEVISVIRDAVRSATIVITTGGLGPTPDDRTLEFIAKALNRPLELNPQALEMVSEKYSRVGLDITDVRRKMALMPKGSRPIPNPVGSAPGAHIVVDGVHIFALPGVPSEMKAMFESYVVKVISSLVPETCVVEKGMTLTGYPESEIAPLIKILSKKYPRAYIKSHPKGGELTIPVLDIKVLVSKKSCREAEEEAIKILGELERLIDEYKPRRVGVNQ